MTRDFCFPVSLSKTTYHVACRYSKGFILIHYCTHCIVLKLKVRSTHLRKVFLVPYSSIFRAVHCSTTIGGKTFRIGRYEPQLTRLLTKAAEMSRRLNVELKSCVKWGRGRELGWGEAKQSPPWNGLKNCSYRKYISAARNYRRQENVTKSVYNHT